METPGNNLEDTDQPDQEVERLKNELAILFGRETVDLAGQIDIADLNLNDQMTDSITAGVRKLKELRDDPVAQTSFVKDMDEGARLLLCMWIMDMDLLDKIRDGFYNRSS